MSGKIQSASVCFELGKKEHRVATESYFLPKNFTIQRIPFAQARTVIEQRHYTHSLRKGRECFGLFDPQHALKGCAVYGQPSMRLIAPSVIDGGTETSVLELLRLWISDSCAKNAESWFLAKTIRQLPPAVKALVAYSAPSAGHYGACYQAANWLYVGRSKSGQNYYYIDSAGNYVHKRVPWVAAKKQNISERDAALKANLQKMNEGRKYVYVYLRDRRLKSKREILPYPKPGQLDRVGYDKSNAHPNQ